MDAAAQTVLVVDDIEDNRYTLIRRLRRYGIESILQAENGRAALDILHGQPVDLVLLDIMMPDVDGYAVLQEIKADMRLREIPVIMISAIDELDSVVACIKLGAEDYLQKPFNATVLQARVQASLEKKRLRDLQGQYLQRINSERQRADDLLNAILPPGAVRELKETNTVRPRRYDDVAVLFCDVVGFTAYCNRHEPEQVVDTLQRLVERFEDIAGTEGLEKIKTIGDAFLATAGLFERPDHALLAATRAGLAMARVTQEIEPAWQVRIGIHQGPIVAGIMGRRQFLFDLWGDTVNLAARLSEHAEPGTVVMAGETWLGIQNQARGHSRGLVALKGKGDVELVECRGVDG